MSKKLFWRTGAVVAVMLCVGALTAAETLARAGGGGSSSSDSSSSYSSSSRGSDSSSSDGETASGAEMISLLVFFSALITFMVVMDRRKKKKLRNEMSRRLVVAAAQDSLWQEESLRLRVKEVFQAFQKAWGENDIERMRGLLTEEFFKKMVLELSVLENMKRRNVMEGVRINSVDFQEISDEVGNGQGSFMVLIAAQAKDRLLETDTGKMLYVEKSQFRENWTFYRVGDVWKLGRIDQLTASRAMHRQELDDFARRHGFYFDADFGWLMMPNRGVLFSETDFKTSDINNHVIGWHRGKIVEFYSYLPRAKRPSGKGSRPDEYVVAQAILPLFYRNILIKRDSVDWFDRLNRQIRSLRKMELEDPDFNRKFDVYAHQDDQISSLELLTPNFMVKILDLPFVVSIEIVGNVLYLYVNNESVSHEQMLEVLNWAFDEMKM